MKYREYLQTDAWADLRMKRLEIDERECVLCGKPAECVHHRRYITPYGTETVKDLVSLCNGCHAIHHGKVPRTRKKKQKPTTKKQKRLSKGRKAAVTYQQEMNRKYGKCKPIPDGLKLTPYEQERARDRLGAMKKQIEGES
jgi:hypothetical protein